MLAARGQVTPAPEPPYHLLYDPLGADLVADGPLARARFVTRWGDTPALEALARRKRGPLPGPLAEEMAAWHRRLHAAPASLAALDRLARGEAVCTVSGQQPAPLGGPLYVLHKVASTVALARMVEQRTGVPCVPLFWMHGEDSDFDEIRGATVVDAALTLHDLALPADAHRDGQLIGGLPLAPLATLEAEAVRHWSGLPAMAPAGVLLEHARRGARDLGEAFSALMLELFVEQGLVVIDPRLPAFRAAARPILERYLVSPDALSDAARRAGAWLEQQGATRALSDAALESFVFAVDDGVRRKVSPGEARDRHLTLSPSVALRPAVQDGVFPTVAMACGPGEIAYLAQLREVFEGVGVAPAAPVPRFSATWLPAAAAELIEVSSEPGWKVVAAADAVIRRLAETRVPDAVRAELSRVHADVLAGLERYAEAARTIDASLPQLVDSARAKVDFQFQRLHEGLVAKVRHKLERQHPEWVRVRYVLQPGDKLQERRLASLEPVVRRGQEVIADVCEMAMQHARRTAEGALEHWLVDL